MIHFTMLNNHKIQRLKVWLKLNKFYNTIVQVTEHKKTNKMVFV